MPPGQRTEANSLSRCSSCTAPTTIPVRRSPPASPNQCAATVPTSPRSSCLPATEWPRSGLWKSTRRWQNGLLSNCLMPGRPEVLVLSHGRRALSRFASERGSLGETDKSPKGREITCLRLFPAPTITRPPAMTANTRSMPPCRRLRYFGMRQTALAGRACVRRVRRRCGSPARSRHRSSRRARLFRRG